MPVIRFGTVTSSIKTEPTINTVNPVSQQFSNDKFTGGRGIKFPLRRDKKGDYENISGKELLKQKVAQILATNASSGIYAGEIEGTPDFGSRLWLLSHRNLDETTRELAKKFSEEAITIWAPEIKIIDISVTLDSIDNNEKIPGISISVKFKSNKIKNSDIIDITLVKRS